jgi:hypothetical protein
VRDSLRDSPARSLEMVRDACDWLMGQATCVHTPESLRVCGVGTVGMSSSFGGRGTPARTPERRKLLWGAERFEFRYGLSRPAAGRETLSASSSVSSAPSTGASRASDSGRVVPAAVPSLRVSRLP